MNNPKKNFIYNLAYQVLILIIPLITAPYLSRVVGADGVGVYTFTYSIVYYFMLFVLLGVNNYGNRSIAKVRDNKNKLSKTFIEIYSLQLILGFIMILLYIIYIVLFCSRYKFIAILQSLFLISSILDINWFFFGIEEFKKTITRNTLIKIGNIILIFIFVRKQEDLWKYTLIMSGMTCLGQLVLWKYLKNKIKFIRVSIKDIIKHLKPNLILFIPVIAISLYKMMDKVMLGMMSTISEVGFYENAEKIVNIPMTFITALGTVMLPRVSNIAANGDIETIRKYIKKSIKFVMFLSFAMCFGLICIGNEFAPLYFGKGFEKTGILIMMLAITLPFLSFANVLRTQYLIPNENDKKYIISVVLGAISNLIMNIIFIPKFFSIGACIGTITAEAIVMIYQTLSIRKELPVFEYIKNSMPFLFKSIIMFLIIYQIDFFHINIVYKLLIQISTGVVIYFILNIKYINTIINLKKLNIGRRN